MRARRARPVPHIGGRRVHALGASRAPVCTVQTPLDAMVTCIRFSAVAANARTQS